MAIIKWDPLGNIATLQDRINKLFDDSFPHQAQKRRGPPVRLDAQCGYLRNGPGGCHCRRSAWRNKQDVLVEVKDNIMTISGKRSADPDLPATNYYRRERICGNFHRSFTLHAMVLPEQIKAKFKNGVLTVEIPKPVEDTPRQISVDIE